MRTALCAAAAGAFLIGACSGTSDTEANVRKALDEADIQAVEVHVDGDANVVHLSGTVETLAERTRAEEIASATIGTTGRVVNELTVEALDAPLDDPDARLTHSLDDRIDNDAVLRERDVNIAVSDGNVTVSGEVRSAAEKDRVTRILERAPGVVGVSNQLQIHTEH
jgi:hyperosmotically inducible protein